MKTNRGIEYDLEIVESGNKSLTVMAICEDGSKEFTIEYPYEFDRHMTEAIDRDDFDYLIDDFSEIEKFVDSKTVSFISSEIASICVNRSSNSEYWSFHISTLDAVRVTILQSQCVNGCWTVLDKYEAVGQDAINDLIYNLNV